MNGVRKRMYLLHRWTGLLLAMLGMLVFFSGAVATFHEEIEAWATRGDFTPPLEELEGFDLDASWATARAGVDPKYLHQVDIRKLHGGPLTFFMHEHVHEGGGVVEVGVYRVIDPRTGELLITSEGAREDVVLPLPDSALAKFFLDLHIFLLLPQRLGLIATGIAGFGLTVLIGTGVIVHRPTRRNLTRAPSKQRSRRFLGELHKWLGLWTLPYTTVLAITGMFFSFAGSVLIPVVAMVAFDGDQAQLIRTVVGEVAVSDSAEHAVLDPILRDAMERTQGAELTRIALEHWEQPKANAVFSMVESNHLGRDATNLVYDGHTGAFLQPKPRFGTRPSLGSGLVNLLADLHFGTLLGTLTKILWGLFGVTTCGIAATGLLVYAFRNESDHRGRTFVRAMTLALAGGLPWATATTTLCWIASLGLGAPEPTAAMTLVFLLTLAIAGASGVFLGLSSALALSWRAAGVGFLLLVLVSPIATGIGVLGAWGDPALRSTVAVDAVLILLAVALALAARRVALQSSSAVASASPELPPTPTPST